MSLVAYDLVDRSLRCDGELPWWVWDVLDESDPDLVFWITKGLGAGGTYGLALWHVTLCLINIDSEASWCIGPTFTQVSTTLLPTFKEVLATHFDMHEGQDYDVRWASPYPQITFWWGHHIDFFSANAPERMVGPSISHCSGTEVGLWKEVAFQKSHSRVRCPKAARLQYFGEGTPEGFNWWEKEANFEEGGRHEDPQKHTYRRVRLETLDNPHLPSGYVDNVLTPTYGGDPNRLLSYTAGIFTAFKKGTAYWNFNAKSLVLDVSVSKVLPINLCWDFQKICAWTVIQRQHYYKQGIRLLRYVTLDESSAKNPGLDDALAEFIAKYPPEDWKDVPICIYGDASGHSDSHKVDKSDYGVIKETLRRYYSNVTVKAQENNPRIRTRLTQTNNLFLYEQAAIAKWCVNTVRAYTMTCRKEGSWDLEKSEKDDTTHFSDANDYGLFEMTKGTDLEAPERERLRGLHKRL